MGFNPKDHGFAPVGSTMRDSTYCYVRIGRHGKYGRATLMLDAWNTAAASRMFGDRVGVAIDDAGRIVLYAGTARKLSKVANTDRASVSIDVERGRLVGALGKFSVMRYDAEPFAGGEAILLTPAGKID